MTRFTPLRDTRRRQFPPLPRRDRVREPRSFETRAAWLASLVERDYLTERGVLVRDVYDPFNGVWIRANEDKRKARQG